MAGELNHQVVEVLKPLSPFGESGGLQKRLALWPHSPLLLDEAARLTVATRTGYLPVYWGHLERETEKLDWLPSFLDDTNTRPFLVIPPWSYVNEFVTSRGLASFECEGRTFRFRAGDPRRWISEAHGRWWRTFSESAKRISDFLGDRYGAIHVDAECWAGAGVLDDFPEVLAEAIREKYHMVSGVLRGALPHFRQDWNDKWGWRDTNEKGWWQSPRLPRPIDRMPGDVGHQPMFAPADTGFLQRIIELWSAHPLPARPIVWNIALGLSAGPQHYTARVRRPIHQNWVKGVWYHPRFSWGLGLALGGHRIHPAWDAAGGITEVSIETHLLKPDFQEAMDRAGSPVSAADHLRAFVAGYIGQPGETGN